MARAKSSNCKGSERSDPPARPYTIREFADLLGTSVATVSRALRDADGVGPAMRQRVREAAERLGYIPSAQPSILRTARTHVVVALVGDIANPFFSEVIRGIDAVARVNGYSVLLGDTQNDQTKEAEYWRLVSRKQADGIITMLPRLHPVGGNVRIPVVNAGERLKDGAVPSVFVNNAAAGTIATNYLVELGHRDIAFLSGPSDIPVCAERHSGYVRALRTAKIPLNLRLLISGDFSVESGIRAVRALLATGAKFTAIFCANDEMAIGAILAIKESGRRVPHDISVIGFDDIQFARYNDPALTTIAQPKMQLGSEAMTLLLQILKNPEEAPKPIVLPTELIVRASTGAPPR